MEESHDISYPSCARRVRVERAHEAGALVAVAADKPDLVRGLRLRMLVRAAQPRVAPMVAIFLFTFRKDGSTLNKGWNDSLSIEWSDP